MKLLPIRWDLQVVRLVWKLQEERAELESKGSTVYSALQLLRSEEREFTPL
jgi:hypothetical protein